LVTRLDNWESILSLYEVRDQFSGGETAPLSDITPPATNNGTATGAIRKENL